MSVRLSMGALITRTRELIGDPSALGLTLEDYQVQDALDQRRWDVRYQELEPAETIGPGGTVTWTHFYADRGDWEDSVVLQSSDWATVTPDTADLLRGLWTFTAGLNRDVFLTGASYDIHAAAADLCELILAEVYKCAFDFSVEGTAVQRSQKIMWLEKLRDHLREHELPNIIPMYRGDQRSNTSSMYVGSRLGFYE